MRAQFGDVSNVPGITKEMFVVQAPSALQSKAGALQYELDLDVVGSSDGARPYPEDEVDEVRKQKDLQLQLYMQEVAMKEQLLAKMRANPGEDTGATAGRKTKI
jgi:hypothetical protein